ncbi:hypothetical protein [Roseovarius sp.]|uniref:hypothetical protein n=1 Tax=Roseovarius sp. TaxID=1486281 RepID=UPI003518DA55
MIRLPWKVRKKIRESAEKLALEERRLALIKQQRQSLQRALDELLTLKAKEPRNAGDT